MKKAARRDIEDIDQIPVATPLTWEQVFALLPRYVGGIFETVEDGVVYRGEYESETHGTASVDFKFSRTNVRREDGWQKWHRLGCSIVICSLDEWVHSFDGVKKRMPSAPRPYYLPDGRIIFSTYNWSPKGVHLWYSSTVYPRGLLEHAWVE